MRIDLAYGRTGLTVDLPAERIVRVLSYKQAAPLPDPAAAARAALARPTGTPPLEEIVRGKRSACLVICDITRPVPNEVMLRPILEAFDRAGLPRQDVTILIATGMHRASTPAEIVEMVGEEIAATTTIVSHDGRDDAMHVDLGVSAAGVPIHIDRRYVEADVKITLGLIEPHFMAGYSGGRKLVCPGIAGWETIRHWHSPRFLDHPSATMGILEGNPVHEENTAIAATVGCDLIFNVVIDDRRRPLAFFAGDMHEAFAAGVDFVQRIVVDTVPEPVDVVVTSSAGYPLDGTFYQSVKGLSAAAPIVKEGGTIVLASRISEGIGSPEFTELFDRYDSLGAFDAAIAGRPAETIDQWQLGKLSAVRRKAEVTVVTEGLSPETLARLFVSSAPTVERAVAAALDRHGPDATIAVIPKGPYVCAAVA